MIDTKEYIKYIKSQPCLVCGSYPVDPDHLDAVGINNNRKPSKRDYTCVPLCREHHSLRHSMGTRDFEDKYNINLWREAFKLLRYYYIE
tara:strand:+ start:202 stop:468 length:267 start_codon:yes stop_codon:yes gene_type:complete